MVRKSLQTIFGAGQTIYSVEKFQGSDRTFFLTSMGISSQDQLSAEEAFIYDMNRLNVLTSRAKQKMLLVCSQDYLDYIPHERELFGHAAKIRGYTLADCQNELSFDFEHEGTHALQLRWC
jgi:superfamily I DNA and/or RNA helicase